MPVVRIELARFTKMVGADRKKILDRLPYVGLDIESTDRDSVRVEYSPNRPDFGTDFGIARAMRGLLSKEVGLPRYPSSPSGVSVTVDRRLSTVRPFIACASVRDLRLDAEDIRQIISLQEDLHNGIGRKRKAVAIGLHDLDAVRPPFSYRAVGPAFSFVPLGENAPVAIRSILEKTPEGRAYGVALPSQRFYPVITDSNGVVLSFPPIINGNATKVTSKTKNMFVDVTSTNMKAGDDVLAIVATTLAEAGGRLKTVRVVNSGRSRVTPILDPVELPLDLDLVRSVLGLNLTSQEASKFLARSRLAVKGRKVLGPRYRMDLLHPVDIAEEVALGYGIDKIEPAYPASGQPGSFNPFENFLDSVSTVMAGSGMIEMMTYELTDETSLYEVFSRPSADKLAVQNPKSIEHSVLRDSLIPTLAAALTGNMKSDYPQKVFEIGRVYRRAKDGVRESWHLGCLTAHSQSSFTESKMYLESTCRAMAGVEITTAASTHWAFAQGRSASASLNGQEVAQVGELAPAAIQALGLGVPVSGFELDLSSFYELLK